MLTLRQKEVLDYISNYSNQNGVGPTLSEISGSLEMGSSSAAYQHVEILRRKGYLKKLPYQSRAISVFEETDDLKEVPLVGRIALGEPIESLDTSETIKVPRMLVGQNGHHYALEARGDSMNEDGILNGDLILIKQTSQPDNGDIVVAQIAEKGATLKRFYNHGSKIELRPKSSNPNIKPLYLNPGDIEVQGKFCGLIRKGE